ncbi:MAG: hypothetical protein KDD82_27460 [Planctomycetes bacterium]|nr:hypothetical protein [Planctomycetota bacterium]
MKRLACLALGAALGLASAAADEDDGGRLSVPRPPNESWVHLEVGYLPWVDVTADKDYLEPRDGVLFDPRVGPGTGLLGRVSIGKEVSLGLSYQLSEHLERTFDARTRLHLGVLDLSIGGGIPAKGPVQLHGTLGVGVGATVFDFERGYHDTGGAAGTLRGKLGLRVYGRLEVFVEVGGFVWGWDDEAVGWGAWLAPGVGLHF